MRSAASFSANEREVINERRHGWEGASCALLAKVFGTSPQVIAAITKVSASPSVGRKAGSETTRPGHPANINLTQSNGA